jgi:hypothetical protein
MSSKQKLTSREDRSPKSTKPQLIAVGGGVIIPVQPETERQESDYPRQPRIVVVGGGVAHSDLPL